MPGRFPYLEAKYPSFHKSEEILSEFVSKNELARIDRFYTDDSSIDGQARLSDGSSLSLLHSRFHVPSLSGKNDLAKVMYDLIWMKPQHTEQLIRLGIEEFYKGDSTELHTKRLDGSPLWFITPQREGLDLKLFKIGQFAKHGVQGFLGRVDPLLTSALRYS